MQTFISSRDHSILSQRKQQRHFQIGSLLDIKNIYICISTIYHTVLIKSGFKVANASVLFESVPVFLTYSLVRE